MKTPEESIDQPQRVVNYEQQEKGSRLSRNIPALKEIIEERKERAIEDLSTSFAKNRLPLEEYERLVEYINKIESERELIVVEKMVAEYGGNDTPEEQSKKPYGKPVDYDDGDEPDYNPHYTNFQTGNLSVLSSRTISGPLRSGSQFVSILGSQTIKIRKEDLAKRRTVLSTFSLLGNYVILVESGIRVTNRVIPILGSSEVDHKVSREARDGEPELIISGATLLGEVKVKLLK